MKKAICLALLLAALCLLTACVGDIAGVTEPQAAAEPVEASLTGTWYATANGMDLMLELKKDGTFLMGDYPDGLRVLTGSFTADETTVALTAEKENGLPVDAGDGGSTQRGLRNEDGSLDFDDGDTLVHFTTELPESVQGQPVSVLNISGDWVSGEGDHQFRLNLDVKGGFTLLQGDNEFVGTYAITEDCDIVLTTKKINDRAYRGGEGELVGQALEDGTLNFSGAIFSRAEE